jgi:hypothetical protein
VVSQVLRRGGGTKRFLATSENTLRSQIWCAAATYVLIAIVKKKLRLDASLYTCLQILSVSIFENTGIPCALQPYLRRCIREASLWANVIWGHQVVRTGHRHDHLTPLGLPQTTQSREGL